MARTATVEEELRKNPALRREDVVAMREWVSHQPHLPPITDMTLVLFLHCCNHDLKAATRTLLRFYAFQHDTPQMCLGRDPESEELVQIAKTTGTVVLDGRDRHGNVVILQRLLDTDASRYSMDLAVRLSYMLTTVWQLENGTCPGVVFVYDQRGFGLGHLARVSISSIRNMTGFIRDCAPMNVRATHVIYTTALMDTILPLFKPFMKSSLYKTIRTYREEDLESFFEKVPQEILPKEYGGKQLSLEELSEKGYNKLLQYRDFFVESDQNIKEAAALAKSNAPASGVLQTVGSWFGLGK